VGEEFLELRAPYSQVPDELKRLPNWVCFRHELSHGKTNNVPYRADGRGHASSTNPQDWSPFDDALAAFENPTPTFDGLSFMLQRTPYLVFDFDNVIQDENLDPFVASILRGMGDPYAETSYSGEGLR